ncbi:gp41, helicase [Corynebacterium phage BFK20]|uniref:Gp41, helicase n=1 Tax=Corynebacterium phage BFK20 TaxID=28358 RepID=Q3V5F4_9CAUD|nr:DNA helicase [Corynebacterium phage BFK20]CAJ29724.1 gp41, helicase [Corynebacterium phage BFK20]
MSVKPRELRAYQTEAVNAVLGEWVDGKRTCVVLPTGTGKSTVIAKLAEIAYKAGQRVILLAHRRELLDQMAQSIRMVAPQIPTDDIGFVQAERDQPERPIVCASFQTLMSASRLQAVGERTVVLVDEVHHSAASTYAEILSAPNFDGAFKAGFTATLQRADGGLADYWDSIAFERDLRWALDEGFLVPPQGKTVVIPGLDTTNIKLRNGDYAAGDLSEVMMSSVDSTVEAIHTHAPDRRMLIFGAGVEHCQALSDTLSATGIHTALVVGSTSSEERTELFEEFTAGRVQALVTVQVLTEGTDLPACDCVVLARPTRSAVLFTQMVGRALRLHQDKNDALVLDLAGSTRDVAMVTLSSLVPGAHVHRVSPKGDEDPGQVEPAPPRPQREGPLDMVDVDLVNATNALWLKTHIPERPALDGVAFLDGSNGYFAYLLPNGKGDYAVGVAPGRSGKSYILAGGATGTLEQAREAAEAEINRIATLPMRTAPRRTDRRAPSEALVKFAESLGIESPAHKTKARLDDEISVIQASRKLKGFFR